MIYSFANDYSEGCHPSILGALKETNHIQQPGYGEDDYSKGVEQTIRRMTGRNDVDVHLVSGGTQANLLILSSLLKPFESVVSATTGHIFVNETGAIEATGHKVEAVETKDGKLTPDHIRTILNKSRGYHTVRTHAVYISDSTELGTIYTRDELSALSAFCRQNNLLLFMDGARLAMALAASQNDITLSDIASLTDIFYIGGTKCGALFGEAIVISNSVLKNDFKYYLKQRGALMAKGRTMGIQFDRLLRNNLIFDLACHANKMAAKIAEAFRSLNFPMLIECYTNQLFTILPNTFIAKMNKDYDFLIWHGVDKNHSAVRLITSWATPEQIVEKFIEDLRKYM